MAASLLSKSGRVAAFKTLQLQAWGLHRLPAAVFLCTKSEESKNKRSHSAKKAGPTVETPQEDFDISTYKNLQHHEYTPFTFVDYDVELSKFRLPQPSSGRISPRH